MIVRTTDELLVGLARKPGPDPAAHLDRLGRELVASVELWLGDVPYRIRELELYLHDVELHPDPYVHRSPVQLTSGRWAFHRIGSSYRGGTFKGLDVSFGPPDTHGGVLLRTLSDPMGRLVEGSSRLVEHLLRETGTRTVAELDRTLGAGPVTETAPIRLTPARDLRPDPVFASPRVGLTLKRIRHHPTMSAFIGRRLRFLDAPGAIRKGRLQLVLALHEDGWSVERIRAVTGSPLAAVRRWVDAWEAGRAGREPRPSQDPARLCFDLGAATRHAPAPGPGSLP